MQSFCQSKQTIAAIEKNTLLSKRRPAKQKGADWIRSLTDGIAFVLMGLCSVIIILLVTRCCLYDDGGFLNSDAGAGLLIAFVFFAFGIAGIIRSILQKKAEKVLSSENSALDAN
jgi:ABC-type multidrug transport system fused ATPase/permease subunit